MRDRLSELVRQRALVSEHLAWLDGEIAAASAPPAEGARGSAAAPTSTVPPPAMPAAIGITNAPQAAAAIPVVTPAHAGASVLPAGTSGSNPPVTTSAEAPAAVSDELIEQYRVSPAAVHQDVRKGCLLYFAAAFVVLGIVVAILYFTIGTR